MQLQCVLHLHLFNTSSSFTAYSQVVLLYVNTSFLPVPRSFSEQEALTTIGEKLCFELSQCLSQHGYSPFSADRKSSLMGQISATIQPDNAVRKLMGKNSGTYDEFHATATGCAFYGHIYLAVTDFFSSSLRLSGSELPPGCPGVQST